MGGFLRISRALRLPAAEIEFLAIRAQGPGGQHVNKAATAVQLRFDIAASSLPDDVKRRLSRLADSRVSRDGVVVIKAQAHRSREKNRAEALERLADLIRRAAARTKQRIPTRPTGASQRRRLEKKTQRGRIKALRRRPAE
jgi:ribosome-associated protein